MPSKPRVPASPTLLSLEPDWLRELRAANRSPHTIRGYLSRFNMFCSWLAPDGQAAHCAATLADIDRETITTYFEHLYAHKSVNTVLNSYIALTVYFDFAIDLIDAGSEELHNPLRWIKRPKPEIVPPAILTDDQIRALLATCEAGKDFKSRRDYALLRVFLSTGMRASELVALERKDAHLDEGVIAVLHGKGGRQRTVAVGVRTVRALGRYLHVRDRHNHADLPALWLSQRGAMAYQTVYGMVVARAKAAGIEHLYPHLMRHLFAHGYLAGGGQESALLQLAGWRDSKMLQQRYGASLASERAIIEHHKLGIGERW